MDSRKRFAFWGGLGRGGISTLTVALGALLLDGCAFVDEMMLRTATPDTRAQLGWQDAIVVSQRDIPEYTCRAPYIMRCERRGVSYECVCR